MYHNTTQNHVNFALQPPPPPVVHIQPRTAEYFVNTDYSPGSPAWTVASTTVSNRSFSEASPCYATSDADQRKSVSSLKAAGTRPENHLFQYPAVTSPAVSARWVLDGQQYLCSGIPAGSCDSRCWVSKDNVRYGCNDGVPPYFPQKMSPRMKLEVTGNGRTSISDDNGQENENLVSDPNAQLPRLHSDSFGLNIYPAGVQNLKHPLEQSPLTVRRQSCYAGLPPGGVERPHFSSENTYHVSQFKRTQNVSTRISAETFPSQPDPATTTIRPYVISPKGPVQRLYQNTKDSIPSNSAWASCLTRSSSLSGQFSHAQSSKYNDVTSNNHARGRMYPVQTRSYTTATGNIGASRIVGSQKVAASTETLDVGMSAARQFQEPIKSKGIITILGANKNRTPLTAYTANARSHERSPLKHGTDDLVSGDQKDYCSFSTSQILKGVTHKQLFTPDETAHENAGVMKRFTRGLSRIFRIGDQMSSCKVDVPNMQSNMLQLESMNESLVQRESSVCHGNVHKPSAFPKASEVINCAKVQRSMTTMYSVAAEAQPHNSRISEIVVSPQYYRPSRYLIAARNPSVPPLPEKPRTRASSSAGGSYDGVLDGHAAGSYYYHSTTHSFNKETLACQTGGSGKSLYCSPVTTRDDIKPRNSSDCLAQSRENERCGVVQQQPANHMTVGKNCTASVKTGRNHEHMRAVACFQPKHLDFVVRHVTQTASSHQCNANGSGALGLPADDGKREATFTRKPLRLEHGSRCRLQPSDKQPAGSTISSRETSERLKFFPNATAHGRTNCESNTTFAQQNKKHTHMTPATVSTETKKGILCGSEFPVTPEMKKRMTNENELLISTSQDGASMLEVKKQGSLCNIQERCSRINRQQLLRLFHPEATQFKNEHGINGSLSPQFCSSHDIIGKRKRFQQEGLSAKTPTKCSLTNIVNPNLTAKSTSKKNNNAEHTGAPRSATGYFFPTRIPRLLPSAKASRSMVGEPKPFERRDVRVYEPPMKTNGQSKAIQVSIASRSGEEPFLSLPSCNSRIPRDGIRREDHAVETYSSTSNLFDPGNVLGTIDSRHNERSNLVSTGTSTNATDGQTLLHPDSPANTHVGLFEALENEASGCGAEAAQLDQMAFQRDTAKEQLGRSLDSIDDASDSTAPTEVQLLNVRSITLDTNEKQNATCSKIETIEGVNQVVTEKRETLESQDCTALQHHTTKDQVLASLSEDESQAFSSENMTFVESLKNELGSESYSKLDTVAPHEIQPQSSKNTFEVRNLPIKLTCQPTREVFAVRNVEDNAEPWIMAAQMLNHLVKDLELNAAPYPHHSLIQKHQKQLRKALTFGWKYTSAEFQKEVYPWLSRFTRDQKCERRCANIPGLQPIEIQLQLVEQLRYTGLSSQRPSSDTKEWSTIYNG